MEFDKNLPVYWQIIEIIKMRIIRQEYLPGDMAPTIRSLSDEFCVTSNTMQRAYVELIREGILVSMRGLGYKITDEKRKLLKLRDSIFEDRLEKFRNDFRKMGVSDIDICKIFDKFMDRDELEK